MAPWLRLRAPNAGALGLILGQGTRFHMPQQNFMIQRVTVKIQYKLSTPSYVINEKTLYVLNWGSLGNDMAYASIYQNNHNLERTQMYMNTVGCAHKMALEGACEMRSKGDCL